MTTALPRVENADPPLTPVVRELPSWYERFTREGTMFFRLLRLSLFGPEKRFWDHWKANQRAWVERGFSIARDDKGWHAQQWLTKDRTLTPLGAETLARLINPQEQGEFLFDDPATFQCAALPDHVESKLFAYQRQPARQLHRALTHGNAEWGYPGAADLSDMGLGKTYQGLAATLTTGKKVAVLCPVVGKPGWERAFAHFGAEPHFLETYEAVRGNWRSEIVSLRGDNQFHWKNPGEMVLIMDEAQACRHDDTLNFRVCSAAIRQGIPILVASATVATSPLEMRFAGRITGLHAGGPEWERFLYAHGCAQWERKWRWNRDLGTLRRIHGRLFPRRGCRVRKEDLGEACPETIIEVVPIECPDAVAIDLQWKSALALIDRMRKSGVHRGIITARERLVRMEVWKRSEMALVAPVAALARRELSQGRSAVVFMSFTEARLAMGAALGSPAGFFGGQTAKARKWYEDQFQANRIHTLVNNIGAGGSSVSLHDVTGERPRTSFIFPTDHVLHMVQASGRIDRVGGKSISRQFIPTVKGTIAERMVRNTRRKMMAISTLNDGEASARI